MASLQTLPVLLALSAIVSVAAMIWLLVNARGVARLFARSHNELEPGAKLGPQPERRSVWIALALFNLGWIAAVAIWTLGIVAANEGPPAGTRDADILPQSMPSH